jgi:hypothetical protein
MGGDAGITNKHAPIVSQVVVGLKSEMLNTRRDCETLVSP